MNASITRDCAAAMPVFPSYHACQINTGRVRLSPVVSTVDKVSSR